MSDESPTTVYPQIDWQTALDFLESLDPHTWRWRELCREGSGQHLEARLTVIRLAGGTPPDPAPIDQPTPEDLALRSYVARHGCGGCGG